MHSRKYFIYYILFNSLCKQKIPTKTLANGRRFPAEWGIPTQRDVSMSTLSCSWSNLKPTTQRIWESKWPKDTAIYIYIVEHNCVDTLSYLFCIHLFIITPMFTGGLYAIFIDLELLSNMSEKKSYCSQQESSVMMHWLQKKKRQKVQLRKGSW